MDMWTGDDLRVQIFLFGLGLAVKEFSCWLLDEK